jgi:hypothetical protein
MRGAAAALAGLAKQGESDMAYDVMIDLETLGTRPDAAIISIGAATFDRKTGEIFERFHVRVSPDLDKYSVDLSTIRWWLTQSEEARQSLAQEVIPLADGLVSLRRWWANAARPEACVWAFPATFDLPILENAMREEFSSHMWSKTMWKYDATRDMRTLCDLASITKEQRVKPKLAHDALSDCEAQIATLVLAMEKLGLSKVWKE